MIRTKHKWLSSDYPACSRAPPGKGRPCGPLLTRECLDRRGNSSPGNLEPVFVETIDEVPDAVHQRVCEPFLDRRLAPGEIDLAPRRLAPYAARVLDEALGRLRTPVEDDVLDEPEQLRRDVLVDGKHVLSSGQHGDDHLGACDCRRCIGHDRDSIVLRALQIVRHQIEALHPIPGLDAVGGHRVAHIAEADEGDGGHGLVSPGCDLGSVDIQAIAACK